VRRHLLENAQVQHGQATADAPQVVVFLQLTDLLLPLAQDGRQHGKAARRRHQGPGRDL
jgi:hypothetical protein